MDIPSASHASKHCLRHAATAREERTSPVPTAKWSTSSTQHRILTNLPRTLHWFSLLKHKRRLLPWLKVNHGNYWPQNKLPRPKKSYDQSHGTQSASQTLAKQMILPDDFQITNRAHRVTRAKMKSRRWAISRRARATSANSCSRTTSAQTSTYARNALKSSSWRRTVTRSTLKSFSTSKRRSRRPRSWSSFGRLNSSKHSRRSAATMPATRSKSRPSTGDTLSSCGSSFRITRRDKRPWSRMSLSYKTPE